MRIDELINKRKKDLEIEEPPEGMWNTIRDEWKKEEKNKSSISYKHWWKVAAIFFMAATVTLLAFTITLNNKVNQLASLGDISEKYATIENDYLSKISTIENNLSIEKAHNQTEYAWIFDELESLETINKTYRTDIGKSANQDQLVEALIDYYEKRLRLLKKLELEIERTKRNKDNEKNSNITINS